MKLRHIPSIYIDLFVKYPIFIKHITTKNIVLASAEQGLVLEAKLFWFMVARAFMKLTCSIDALWCTHCNMIHHIIDCIWKPNCQSVHSFVYTCPWCNFYLALFCYLSKEVAIWKVPQLYQIMAVGLQGWYDSVVKKMQSLLFFMHYLVKSSNWFKKVRKFTTQSLSVTIKIAEPYGLPLPSIYFCSWRSSQNSSRRYLFSTCLFECHFFILFISLALSICSCCLMYLFLKPITKLLLILVGKIIDLSQSLTYARHMMRHGYSLICVGYI